ncbi:MAG: chemotaxis protein CheA [bacterium]
MSKNSDKHKDVFREEAQELLVELEAALIELEELPGDEHLVDRVFRAIHTIKGSGAMFGFDDVSAFAHELETVFDLVRTGEMKVSQDLIDIALNSRDLIREMLTAQEHGQRVDQKKPETILALLKNFAPAVGEKQEKKKQNLKKPEQTKQQGTSAGIKPEKVVTYRIRFRPKPELFARGTNPLSLLNELRRLGHSAVVAHRDAIPYLGDMNPELCYTSWDIILTTPQRLNAIRDVFIFVEEEADLKIEVIDEGGMFDDEYHYKKIGEILLERGDLKSEDLIKVLSKQKRLGEMLVDAGVVPKGHVDAALAEQEHIKEIIHQKHSAELVSSIRVPSERLDHLVNLVGELVTVQARLSQTCAYRNDPELLSVAEEVERLTVELRDNTMSIRMVPIGTTFSKFKRLVRDLSRDLGKEVELVTEGAETELDKTVIEKLNDPLVHIIRNSIGHGIELPDEREAAGKSRTGTILLSASHSGPYVFIRIKDDGRGLDREAIRMKAIENGLILPDTELTDDDVFSLIFEPGFSTAREVTNVYGRGVGMDVLKKAIEELRGSVEVMSHAGKGTTIVLKLPLTLAIIEGLLVRVGNEKFILPLSMVEECIELIRADREQAHGRQIVHVRERLVPYIRLRDQFMIGGGMPAIEQIVIVGSSGNRVGFVVDTVIGGHQTVLKSLGRMYRHIDGVSGATILGDGTVALILDIPKLIQVAEKKDNGTGAGAHR